ncbi:hypothetical protein ABT104_26635 [Streptomyces mobaraensis]|uniref:DUF7848 domain-containing protein n=1 Tax=Streptomyces mobaraensis TaxID=35621 RepID=UPI00331ADE1D
MTVRAVYRHVDWRLTVDPNDDRPQYTAKCMTCGDIAELSFRKAAPEVWCLRHARRTGHQRFCTGALSFLIATCADR